MSKLNELRNALDDWREAWRREVGLSIVDPKYHVGIRSDIPTQINRSDAHWKTCEALHRVGEIVDANPWEEIDRDAAIDSHNLCAQSLRIESAKYLCCSIIDCLRTNLIRGTLTTEDDAYFKRMLDKWTEQERGL